MEVWVLGGEVEFEVARTGFVLRERGPGLHCVRDHSLILQVDLGGVGRVLEGVVRGALVTEFEVEGDVVVELLVDPRRVVVERVALVDGRVLSAVVHVDEVDAVLRGIPILRDHDGDRLADVSHPVGREHRPVRVLQARELPAGRDHPRHVDVLAGVDGQHAVEFLGRTRVDALDRRVAVLAPHDRHVGHVRPLDVVGVLGLTGDQRGVLAALDRRPEHGLGVDVLRFDGIDTHLTRPPRGRCRRRPRPPGPCGRRRTRRR